MVITNGVNAAESQWHGYDWTPPSSRISTSFELRSRAALVQDSWTPCLVPKVDWKSAPSKTWLLEGLVAWSCVGRWRSNLVAY